MTCENCKNTCKPLVTPSNMESSEWYCEKCHSSYPMEKEEINYFISQKRGQ